MSSVIDWIIVGDLLINNGCHTAAKRVGHRILDGIFSSFFHETRAKITAELQDETIHFCAKSKRHLWSSCHEDSLQLLDVLLSFYASTGTYIGIRDTLPNVMHMFNGYPYRAEANILIKSPTNERMGTSNANVTSLKSRIYNIFGDLQKNKC
jgi:hypothetical protein